MERQDFSEEEKVEKLTAELMVCKAKIAALTEQNEKLRKTYDQSVMMNVMEEGRVKGLKEAISTILEAQSGREKE